jgi:hypothetical protein
VAIFGTAAIAQSEVAHCPPALSGDGSPAGSGFDAK